MLEGVLHEIDQHLLDQRSVHGNHEQFVGHLDGYFAFRKPFSDMSDRFRGNFFRRLRRLADMHRAFVDPRYRKKVFHHADQPLRVLLDIGDQLVMCALIQIIAVFQYCGACPKDSCKWCAQIVRNRAKQVASHFFFFRFDDDPSLFVG